MVHSHNTESHSVGSWAWYSRLFLSSRKPRADQQRQPEGTTLFMLYIYTYEYIYIYIYIYTYVYIYSTHIMRVRVQNM